MLNKILNFLKFDRRYTEIKIENDSVLVITIEFHEPVPNEVIHVRCAELKERFGKYLPNTKLIIIPELKGQKLKFTTIKQVDTISQLV